MRSPFFSYSVFNVWGCSNLIFSKVYRLAGPLNLSQSATQRCTALSGTQCLFFWSFPIVLSSRDVWYRVLHRKNPCVELLYKLIPTAFPSPSCHVLYECPTKLPVWIQVWPKYFTSPFSTSLLQQALIRLFFPRCIGGVGFVSSIIIRNTLLSIWRLYLIVVRLLPRSSSWLLNAFC